jgi:hypothetical protein
MAARLLEERQQELAETLLDMDDRLTTALEGIGDDEIGYDKDEFSPSAIWALCGARATIRAAFVTLPESVAPVEMRLAEDQAHTGKR